MKKNPARMSHTADCWDGVGWEGMGISDAGPFFMVDKPELVSNSEFDDGDSEDIQRAMRCTAS